MSDTPAAGHNRPPQSKTQKLFVAARTTMRAHSRHTKDARKQLCASLVHLMEICEHASMNADNRRAVELELHEAGVLHLKKEGDWFRPLVTAAFDEADRKREATNISKYVSVLSHAERLAKGSDKRPSELLKQLLGDGDGASIAKVARMEAEARRDEKTSRPGPSATRTRSLALKIPFSAVLTAALFADEKIRYASVARQRIDLQDVREKLSQMRQPAAEASDTDAANP